MWDRATPDLEDTAAPDTVRIVLGARKVKDFVLVSGSSPQVFKGVNGEQGVVKRIEGDDSPSAPELYEYYDAHGNVWTFFGYHTNSGAWMNPHGAMGQLWTVANADGSGEASVQYTGHATNPATALSTGFELDGSSNPTARAAVVYDGAGRKREYEYEVTISSAPMLTAIKIYTDTDPTSGVTWTLTWKVDFDYYTTEVEDQGSAGDLKTITETRPLTSGGDEVRTTYFRYYTYDSSLDADLTHLIKFRVDPEGVRRVGLANLGSTTDANLKQYASLYYEYNDEDTGAEANGDGRVNRLEVGAHCGCGSGDGVYTFTMEEQSFAGGYTTDGATGTGDWAETRWKQRTIVTHPNGAVQALYFDEMGWLLGKVVSDAAAPSTPFDETTNQLWITKYQRDGFGRVTKEFTPAAVDSSQYDHATGEIVVRSGAGLVNETTYRAPDSGSNYLLYAVASRGTRVGSSGSAETLVEFTYLDPTSTAAARDFGTTLPVRLAKPLLSSRKVYRATGVYDETTFGYVFYSSSWRPKKITTTLPALASGDISGPTAVSSELHLDDQGRTVFSRDGAGVYTFRQYSDAGLVTKEIRDPDAGADGDVTTDASAFGITVNTEGLHYSTQYGYDLQGRLVTVTLPSGRVSVNHYTKLSDGRLVSLFIPKQSGASPTTSEGPIGYSVRNLADSVEAQAVIGLSNGTTTDDVEEWIDETSGDVIGAVDTGTVKQLMVNLYDGRGSQLNSTRLFNTIPASYSAATSGQYEETFFGYDPAGKRRRIKDPTGTIDYSKLDKLGREYEHWTGTNDNDADFPGGESSGTEDMVKVSTTVYDSGGIGNSLVTSRTAHVDTSSGNDRTTTYTYDYRGRAVVQVNPVAPHFVRKYDTSSRLIAVGSFTTSPGAIDPTTTGTMNYRVALTKTVFNSRGQVKESVRYKIDQTDGSDDDTLSTYTWFDGAGRVVKTRGSQITKTTYDTLGMPTHRYILGDDNDSEHAHVLDVEGDKVLEEHQSLYDHGNETGNLLMSVSISRHPEDTTTTGALDAVSDGIDVVNMSSGSFKGRAQIRSYYYDDPLERQTAVVELGTNGGATYTRSSDGSAGSRSATRLITSTVYNPEGTVLSVTDPRDKTTRMVYDAAGRTTAEVRNYNNGTPSGGDDDVYTRYAYTDGLMTHLWVDVQGDDTNGVPPLGGNAQSPADDLDQVTTYTYGVIKTGTLASLVASERFLKSVQYPDSSGGSDIVTYAYNQLGEQTSMVDQAATRIDTSYDKLGRETARVAAALGTGIDGAVRRIEMEYQVRGPISTVTQYDAMSSGTALDQVMYQYDGWGNIEYFHQDVDSAMSSPGVSAGSTRDAFSVQYAYAISEPSGGALTLRRSNMYLKSEAGTFQQLNYSYGSGISASISRVASLTLGPSSPVTIASYDYLGADHVVGTTWDQPALNTSVYTESSGTHTYGDLDQFNRPLRWNWERIGAGSFYNVQIGWDQNSNPTYTVDDVHIRNSSPAKHLFDVVYTLDDLNRVIGTDEGNRSGSTIESGFHTRNEVWNSLSLTGNWGNRQLDADGDGTFTGAADRNEPLTDNVFNKANEWTARKVTKTGTDRDEYTYTYDAAGNLTREQVVGYRSGPSFATDRGFVYDAFGRLVRLVGIPVEETETIVARYRYNGLGFRIMSQQDEDVDSTLEDSERYYAMFDERWRQVATFRDQDEDPKEAFVFDAAGLGGFGGSSYIDTVILRDRDNSSCGGGCVPWRAASDGTLEERRYYCQNWRADVVAITKSDGSPLERVRYSSYGEPTVYPIADVNLDGVVNSADATAWGYGSPTSDYAAATNADLDFDGDTGTDFDNDLFTESYDANLGLSGKGRVSSSGIGNRKGYAGYEWTQVTRAYHVRHRWLFSDIGRWGRRDPIVAWLLAFPLYEYCASRSLRSIDWSGLQEAQPKAKKPKASFKTICESNKASNDCYERLDEQGRKRFKTKVLDKEKPPLTWDGTGWYGVAFCKDATAQFCLHCHGIKSFVPSDLAKSKDETTLESVDFALGLIADCVKKHEQVHVDDMDCQGVGDDVAAPRKYKSGSRAASENKAYGEERACVVAAIEACGDDAVCKKIVTSFAVMFNKGAKKYNKPDPIDPVPCDE